MPCAEERPGLREPAGPRPGGSGASGQLTRLQSALTDLLCVIYDDARQMDANLDDAHDLVQSIRMLVRQRVLRPGRPADDSQQLHAYHAFELARIAENDAYEVYAGDLECFRKRQRLNLGVAESDSDRLALVKRRRAYISVLLAYQSQISPVLGSCT